MATDMNMDFGYFTSAGTPFIVPVRSDIDYFEILNYTQMATTQSTGRVVRSSWQRGFPVAQALTGTKTNSTNAMNETIATSGGFTLVNTSVPSLGTPVAYSAITNATPPVVSTSVTTGLATGSVVKIYNPAAYQIAGMDFTIDTVVASTSFNLTYMIAPGDAAPGAGTYAIVNNPNTPLYAPRKRFITNVTQATSAVVTFSVTHGYVVGEIIQFFVGKPYGMTELNGLRGTITAINTTTNTVTVNIDTTGFSAWAFPRASNVPFTFAQAVPDGEIPTIQTAATFNQSVLGIQVGTAVCGSANDVLFWRAWKAFRYTSNALPTS